MTGGFREELSSVGIPGFPSTRLLTMYRRKQNPTFESSENIRKALKTPPETASLFSGVSINHAQESCTIQLRGDTFHIRYRDGVPSVNINGKPLVHPDESVIVKMAAPVKYTEEHFKQVDTYMQRGWGIGAATEQVSIDNSFISVEGFRRQYRERWFNRKVTPSKLTDV